jgi:hypothetical protein
MVNELTSKGDMVDGGQVEGRVREGRVREGRAREGRASETHRDWRKKSPSFPRVCHSLVSGAPYGSSY